MGTISLVTPIRLEYNGLSGPNTLAYYVKPSMERLYDIDTGVNTINLLNVVMKSSVFVTARHFRPSKIQARLEPTRVEPLKRLHSNCGDLAMPANVRLGWK